MPRLLLLIALFAPICHTLSANPLAQAGLSDEERTELTARLKRFYSQPNNGDVMSERIPKYEARSGRPMVNNPFLMRANSAVAGESPLLARAQAKATDSFQKLACDGFLDRHFPGLKCKQGFKGRGAVEANDRVENLSRGWLEGVQYDLDAIPQTGQVAQALWSDDYWRMRWGLTSFRYSEFQFGKEFKTYKEAIASYAQPLDWTRMVGLPIADLEKKIIRLSPSEKYDLSVGDETFALTNQQKQEGKDSVGDDGNIEEWMGLCHGWAAAAAMVPKPTKAMAVYGPRGARIAWYPNDVRAMATLAWSNGSYNSNYIGGRCDVKGVKTYPNGRIKQQDCFDNNPSTFHLALANMIGRAKQSFVMDNTFDFEVWNQPIHSYDFTYFNPIDPEKMSKSWSEVAVNYDAAFKKVDRFQNPRTRGVNTPQGFSDSKIRKVVGVVASVVYAAEFAPPVHGPKAEEDLLVRVSFTYDLELYENQGRLIPLGGEWHNNAHPDFLWVPERGAVATNSFDYTEFEYTGATVPTASLAAFARQASAYAYPLCRVLKPLVRVSSGVDGYLCPEGTVEEEEVEEP